ncbi:MAG: M56 family metallopeptidase [Candidatus Binataceae bacterium]|nr:M56 family metallopeptidase [Candidatus Binataceae bacterium]
MERESCLAMLIALFGGIAIFACGWWHRGPAGPGSARSMERLCWRRLWLPLAPAVIVAAWLCGWALVEPDPVPEKVPSAILIASLPFILLFARTAIRAGWSLLRDDGDPGTATVGLLKPWILFSPHLARTLDQAEIDAALEHERAHARHRDPLRIWLAQLATDLQWPWPQAQERFRHWLVALELARDEEARIAGIEGADLAAAIMAVARLRQPPIVSPLAALIGEQSVLKERIACLLEPRRDEAEASEVKAWLPWTLVPGLLIAVVLGSIFGETIVRTLLRLAV